MEVVRGPADDQRLAELDPRYAGHVFAQPGAKMFLKVLPSVPSPEHHVQQNIRVRVSHSCPSFVPTSRDSALAGRPNPHGLAPVAMIHSSTWLPHAPVAMIHPSVPPPRSLLPPPSGRIGCTRAGQSPCPARRPDAGPHPSAAPTSRLRCIHLLSLVNPPSRRLWRLRARKIRNMVVCDAHKVVEME